MKTKKNFLLIIAVLLCIVVGCQNNKKSQGKETRASSETTDMHSSQNSIDWEGTYFGVLPCASCPGINTLITLNADLTYEKTVEYLESDDLPETTKGRFTWDKAGQIITIGENAYLVEENQLSSLDNNNKKIEGELAENYTLTKTVLEPPLDANEGYTLQIFTGSDDKSYNIIFDTNPKIPTALVETDGFKTMLSQTEAWAQGVEYSGSNTKLTVQGDKVILIIKDQKIELTQK